MVEAFHQAARSLRRQPAFSGSVVAIMALGIGACTAMFSIISAVFLDALPHTEALASGDTGVAALAVATWGSSPSHGPCR